jgi:DNA-binding response OmpR family regulator
MTENFGRPILAPDLTKMERAILDLLQDRANSTVSKDEILALLKGNAAHTIDSHIMAIRRKLANADSTATIETIVRHGFVLHLAAINGNRLV